MGGCGFVQSLRDIALAECQFLQVGRLVDIGTLAYFKSANFLLSYRAGAKNKDAHPSRSRISKVESDDRGVNFGDARCAHVSHYDLCARLLIRQRARSKLNPVWL